jgi:hypothetical protein
MDPNVRWCPKPGCESPIRSYEVVRPGAGAGAGAGGLRLALMAVYGVLLGRLLDVVVQHSWRALLADTAERIASDGVCLLEGRTAPIACLLEPGSALRRVGAALVSSFTARQLVFWGCCGVAAHGCLVAAPPHRSDA